MSRFSHTILFLPLTNIPKSTTFSDSLEVSSEERRRSLLRGPSSFRRWLSTGLTVGEGEEPGGGVAGFFWGRLVFFFFFWWGLKHICYVFLFYVLGIIGISRSSGVFYGLEWFLGLVFLCFFFFFFWGGVVIYTYYFKGSGVVGNR